jgi:hypothetical protein
VAADVSPLIIPAGEKFEPTHVGCHDEIDGRPARQSGSLSGNAQTSRRRLAMTRQASLKIAQPFMAGLNVINMKSPAGTKEFQSNISAL